MERSAADDPQRPTRRAFLTNLLLGISGALGAGMLAQRFFLFLSPPAGPEREVEIPAIELDAIPDGGGRIVHLPAGHVAIERNGDQVRAFSAVCTHLGCVIEWHPDGPQAWHCPCHHGRYDRDGRVLAGPPPRPLTPIPASVRAGQVVVKLTVRAPTGTV
jgi:cytochrome b6-f complex iron-sulfur subunit